MNLSLASLGFLTLSLLAFAGGQVVLKSAVNKSSWNPTIPLTIGTALLGLSFLLDLGLMRRYDLSLLYPFHALSVPMVTASAVVFLREKTDCWLWSGIALITLGIMMVSHS